MRFKCHCWRIAIALLVKIYSASPLEIGKMINIPPSMIGVSAIMRACEGSVTVTGVIFFDGFEKDGDRHLRLKPDPEYESLLVEANISVQHGGLVVEPMCAKAPTQRDTIQEGVCVQFSQRLYDPATMKNTHVSVTGAFVYDTETGHHWNEIHPVVGIRVIP